MNNPIVSLAQHYYSRQSNGNFCITYTPTETLAGCKVCKETVPISFIVALDTDVVDFCRNHKHLTAKDSRIYFSADIETNGLAAGINSMISLGAAAVDMETEQIVGTFEVNLLPLLDLEIDADTMSWWKQFPEAYEKATKNAVYAGDAMYMFEMFVKSFEQDKPVLAVWKPGFDAAFIRYYLYRFLHHDLFGRAGSGLDIKTLTAIALNQHYSETQIAAVPAEWRNREVHDHTALGDAIEQAHVMIQARKVLNARV